MDYCRGFSQTCEVCGWRKVFSCVVISLDLPIALDIDSNVTQWISNLLLLLTMQGFGERTRRIVSIGCFDIMIWRVLGLGGKTKSFFVAFRDDDVKLCLCIHYGERYEPHFIYIHR